MDESTSTARHIASVLFYVEKQIEGDVDLRTTVVRLVEESGEILHALVKALNYYGYEAEIITVYLDDTSDKGIRISW